MSLAWSFGPTSRGEPYGVASRKFTAATVYPRSVHQGTKAGAASSKLDLSPPTQLPPCTSTTSGRAMPSSNRNRSMVASLVSTPAGRV